MPDRTKGKQSVAALAMLAAILLWPAASAEAGHTVADPSPATASVSDIDWP
jgi:hypothetical protein